MSRCIISSTNEKLLMWPASARPNDPALDKLNLLQLSGERRRRVSGTERVNETKITSCILMHSTS